MKNHPEQTAPQFNGASKTKFKTYAYFLPLFLLAGILFFLAGDEAFAEEATSTTPIEEQIVAATTTESIAPEADASAVTESSADSQATTTDAAVLPPAPEEPAPAPAPSPTLTEPQQQPEPVPQPAHEPSPPAIPPIVPFQSSNGHAFDPATAPSKVRLKILNTDGSVPMIPVFVTFVGVGGRTYGGPIDREGTIETIMPTGRYYTDILVLDTKSGPPSDPPSFFLEANEERDFGALTLTDRSSFADEPLEREFATTLEGER